MKFFVIFSFLLFLSACGFTPVHAPKTSNLSPQNTTQSFHQVQISLIPDRSGQYLRNELIDRFYQNGFPQHPTYQLTISPLQETISDFDITVDSDATRRQLKLSTTLTLQDKKTNKTLLSRPLSATTSNNVLVSEFSTLMAEQNAREAALNDLARQIEMQLALYFKR